MLLERLREEPIYEALFPKAFPGEADPVRILNVVRAIGAAGLLVGGLIGGAVAAWLVLLWRGRTKTATSHG